MMNRHRFAGAAIAGLCLMLSACGGRGGADNPVSGTESSYSQALPGDGSEISKPAEARVSADEETAKAGITEEPDVPAAYQGEEESLSKPVSLRILPDNGRLVPVLRQGAGETVIVGEIKAAGERLSASLVGYAADVREGEGLRLRLQNLTEETLTVSAEELMANGCAFTPSYHITLDPGQGRESTVRFPAGEMARYGFKTMGSVRLKLSAAPSSGVGAESLLLEADTSEYEKSLGEMKEKAALWEAAYPLGKAGDIFVTALYLEQGQFEHHLVFHVDNPTGEQVSLRGEALLVNGEKLPFFLDEDIPAAARKLAAGTFLSEDMKVHRIETIEELEITLNIKGKTQDMVIGPAVIPVKSD